MTPLNPRTAEAEVKARDWLLVARPRSARQIIAQVAKDHGLTADELTGPSRKKVVVEARWTAMRTIRAETKLSTPQIGRLFHRDHTTVLHALGTLKHSVASDLRKAAA
jgi:chromosomal replication initiator protein